MRQTVKSVSATFRRHFSVPLHLVCLSEEHKHTAIWVLRDNLGVLRWVILDKFSKIWGLHRKDWGFKCVNKKGSDIREGIIEQLELIEILFLHGRHVVKFLQT